MVAMVIQREAAFFAGEFSNVRGAGVLDINRRFGIVDHLNDPGDTHGCMITFVACEVKFGLLFGFVARG